MRWPWTTAQVEVESPVHEERRRKARELEVLAQDVINLAANLRQIAATVATQEQEYRHDR